MRQRTGMACMVFATGVASFAAILAGLTAGGQTPTTAAAARLTIDTGSIVGPVSPMLYGMMTEEINHALDGGLYAEMLNNRTFRPSWEGIEHWDLVRRGSANAAMEVDHASG